MGSKEIFTLEGKTALVTGASKRLGREIVLALAGEGADCIIHYNSSSVEAEELKSRLLGMGRRAWTVQAALDGSQDCEAIIGKAVELSGSVDILINSASIFPPGGLEGITLESVFHNVEINAWAPLCLSREFARHTRTGRIINMLDTRIRGGDRKHLAYYLSKKMLEELTGVLALELAPGITVNAVAPGLILPPEGKDESYMEKLRDTVPLRMTGHPSYITDAVLFLVRSAFITGQVIYVDGGRHLTGCEAG